MSLATVAAVTLHSLPLSFEANRLAILDGIREAKSKGARLVVTPELCIPGYGCLDHFHEADTFADSWDQVAIILQDPVCKDIIVDLGLGVRHKNVRYNCRILITYKKVLLIKPKMSLANDGLYREMRHFSPWMKARTLETYYLEDVIADVTGQRKVDIGDAIISTIDTSVYSETCEELFVPSSPSIGAGLDGCEIFANASASHAELRKLRSRLDLIANSTRKQGGIYIYSNMVGIDGEARMMYDGSSMVIVNGNPVAQEEPFSLKKSSVITATIDLETVRSFRTTVSRNMQAAAQNEYPRVEVDIRLCRPVADVFLSGSPQISRPIEIKVLDPMEEIYKSTAVVLWQYLSTVGLGYLIPLSGGADSCSTSLMVFGMARLVLESIRDGDDKVLQDLRRVVGESDFQPQTPQDIVGKLFYTVYLGTRNSGSDTRRRAANLASVIGANHLDENIDEIVDAHVNFVKKSLKFSPQFAIYGGSAAEDLALQNIQARTRMVTAYSLAQLSMTARQTSRKQSSLLVLGSANVDEILRGYYTKYDCSSADYNPLGSISKTDVRSFLHFCAKNWDLPCVQDFIDAVPSAELVPVQEGQIQVDETEMGLTYHELSRYGVLRKVEKLGPFSLFLRLLSESEWGGQLSPREIAEKTKTFFKFYAASRHKAVTLTPSVHLSAYNPDDNRHDLRPFLLVISWPWQFKKIDSFVEMLEANQGKLKTIKAD